MNLSLLIEQAFIRFVASLPCRKILIAYSGGLDSSVLLHLFHKVSTEMKLEVLALHINHNLSPNASQWQMFCQDVCTKKSILFKQISVNLDKKDKQGLEAEARKKRYQELFAQADKDTIICTAHHLDDQIETFFLRLLRGSGIKGLASMQALSKQQGYWVARPLLQFDKQQLKDYAQENQISYIEDESNKSLAFERNYLRHKIIPLIKARYPASNKTIARSIQHIQSANELLQNNAKSLYRQLKIKRNAIDHKRLKQHPQEQQIAVLRYWFDKNSIPQPSTKKLDDLLKQINTAKHMQVKIKPVWIKLYRDTLFLVKDQKKHQPEEKIIWNTKQNKKLKIPSVHRTLARKKLKKMGINLHKHPIVEVRFRQGGEQVYIKGVGHQSLKKFFQKKQIPGWERDFIPLIYINDVLVRIYL